MKRKRKIASRQLLDAGGKPSTWFPPGITLRAFIPDSQTKCPVGMKIAVAYKSAGRHATAQERAHA